ncbi:MAG: hypothetical protein KKF56_04785 [Nanoarchaeota archaeon]|nr:hypothetical protein [Nanoarchaeota archaeon]
MEKHLEFLNTAIQQSHLADHLIYTTYPLINEQKLLIKIVIELNKSLENIIKSIIYKEYLYKNIDYLPQDSRTQNEIIRKILSLEETNIIKEIRNLIEKHNKSPMEFSKNNKFVIMTNHLTIDTITIEKIKQFNQTTKNIIIKAKNHIQ